MTPHDAKQWAVRHPRVVDGLLAILLALLALPATVNGPEAPGVLGSGSGVVGAGWIVYVAVHVPLVWRRQAPVIVFWVALGLVGVSVILGITGVFLIFVPLFAMYAVARHRSHRYLWPVLAAVLLIMMTARATGDAGGPELIGIGSILAAVSMLGITLQLRRNFLAEQARHKQQELADEARIAVAAERAQIAREVHDIVAHNLAVMVALADGAAASTATNPQEAADLMEKASATGRQALSDMRQLVGLLKGNEPQPGVEDLDRLVDQIRAAGLHVDLVGNRSKVSPGIGLTVYRIVQEALTNTLKHAGPTAHAKVRLSRTSTSVEVDVTDDGAGRPAPPVVRGGHGLTGITERAKAYGGEVDAGPMLGTGWRVTARLPLTPETDGGLP